MQSPITLRSGKKTSGTPVGVIATDDKQYITRDELRQMVEMMQQMKDTITALTKQNNNKGNTNDVADNTVEQTDNIKEEHYNRRYSFDNSRRNPTYTSRRSLNSDTAAIPNMSNLVKSLYDAIPTYNGDGDIQKLQEFIDKVEIYLELAEHKYEEEIALKT